MEWQKELERIFTKLGISKNEFSKEDRAEINKFIRGPLQNAFDAFGREVNFYEGISIRMNSPAETAPLTDSVIIIEINGSEFFKHNIFFKKDVTTGAIVAYSHHQENPLGSISEITIEKILMDFIVELETAKFKRKYF